ncbi:MAG: extracellular solute-binding protein [Bacilli bacterium]
MGKHVVNAGTKYGSPESTIRGSPECGQHRLFFTIQSILQKVGIHTPPKTLGQFFRDCAIIKNAHMSGVYPFYEIGNPLNWWFYGIYGSAIQGPLVNKSYWRGPHTGALTPEQSARAVSMRLVATSSPQIQKVWTWGKQLASYMPPWAPNMTNQQVDSLFVNGQVAFYWDGNWDYNLIKNGIGKQFKWGTMQLPVVTKQDYPTRQRGECASRRNRIHEVD